MKQIKFSDARKRLVVQWMIFTSIIFVIYFIQTLTGRYEKYEDKVWEWLFKLIILSLSLMIGLLTSQLSA